MTKEAPKRHLKVEMVLFHTGLWYYDPNALTFAFTTCDLRPWSIFGKGILGGSQYVPTSKFSAQFVVSTAPHAKRKKKGGGETHTYGSSETAKLICTFWLDAINFTTENITNHSFHGVIFRGVLQMKPNSTSQAILLWSHLLSKASCWLSPCTWRKLRQLCKPLEVLL